MRVRPKDIRNICVIQLQPFGDVLLTTSCFKALKDYFSGARLVYLTKEPYQKIVENHPYIDRIIRIRKEKGLRYLAERRRIIGELRKEKFDLVIDYQGMPSSQILAFFSGSPHRLGYRTERKNLEFLYTIHSEFGPPRYSAVQKADLLKPLGMTERPVSLILPIPEDDQLAMDAWMKEQGLSPDKTLAISPGSRYAFKKWPAPAFARVADLMAESHGFKTVILWGPGEERDADRVRSLMKTPAFIAPPTSFQKAGAIMKNVAVLVCNDNGITHSSAALGVMTVAVFGPTDPRCWSPAGIYPTHRHLHNPSADKKDPWFGVTADRVFSEVTNLLDLS